MPTKVDQDNPIQGDYERKLNRTRRAQESRDFDEWEQEFDDSDTSQNNDALQEYNAAQELGDAESDTNPLWENRVGSSKQEHRSVSGYLKNINPKKAAPIAGLVAFLIAIAGVVSLFGGPGLAIVNFAEVLTEKFNTQLGSMDARNHKIVEAKLSNTTTGYCGVKVTINCKITTFSDKEIEKFKRAGLDVETDGKSILGRNKVKSFKLDDGTKVDAKSFKNTLANNKKFSNAMKSAYGLKYSGTSDSVFAKVENKLGISKRSPFPEGADDKQRANTIKEETKNGRGKVNEQANPDECADNKCNDTDKQKKSQNATEGAEKGSQITDLSENSATNVADEILQQNEKAIAKGATAGAVKATGATAASIIKITGPIDNACMVYGWTKTISYTAKTVRLLQMARYAMIIMTVAHMIKAGDAREGDTNYIGNILTKTTTDSNGNTSKSATESFGYRYAAYGDSGMDASASTATAGAYFGAGLQSTVDAVLAVTGLGGGTKAADKACHILSNPVVQLGSLAIGVASFIFGAGEVKLSIQAVIAPLIAILGAVMPAMIGDILAGRLVDDNTYGQRAANITASGIGGILSQVANLGGNGITKPDQAQAYMQLQRDTVLSYAEYERSITSPFDASNPNTVLGSIYTSIAPYLNSSTTPMSVIGNIASITSSAARNFFVPKSFAAAQESFTECKDPSYRELNIATDPFCNPVFGIPPQYLEKDPVSINNALIASGDIDEETGEPKSKRYTDFISTCIDREDPYGTSQDGEEDHSDTCFVNDQNADLYVHYIDQRTNNIGENELQDVTVDGSASSLSSIPGAGTSGKDDVATTWRSMVEGCLSAHKSACGDVAGDPSWLGMFPGQCAAFASWRFAQQWYGTSLNSDGSNLEQLLSSSPIPGGQGLALGNGNAVASTLINIKAADAVKNIKDAQAGDIVSIKTFTPDAAGRDIPTPWGHVFVVLSNNNGIVTVEDYNAAGGPGKYGTATFGTGIYTEDSVVAIARVHKDGGAK